MMIKLPVDDAGLVEKYDVIMPEIDRLSLKRRADVWEAWPDFVSRAGTWECLRDFHVMLFGGLFSFAGRVRTCNISKGGFRFANALFLDKILPVISEMPQKNFDETLGSISRLILLTPSEKATEESCGCGLMRFWSGK